MAKLKVEDLYVFDELEQLLDTASPDEVKRLKEDVAENGIEDPIIYWANPPDNKPCIVDGHRRYRLYMDGVTTEEPPTKPMRFRDLEHVKRWMIDRQLSRRNLSQAGRDSALARLLEIEKAKTPSADQRNQSDYVAQGRAVDRVAEQTGVPSPTVQRASKRDAERRQARVKIAKADPRFDEQLADGEFELSDADIRLLGSFKPSEIKEKIVKIRLGQNWKPAEEVPPAPGNVHPKNDKPSKPKSQSIAKTVDEYRKKCVGPLVRGLDIIADINGGQGDNWKRARGGLSEVEAALKEMRKGKQ